MGAFSGWVSYSDGRQRLGGGYFQSGRHIHGNRSGRAGLGRGLQDTSRRSGRHPHTRVAPERGPLTAHNGANRLHQLVGLLVLPPFCLTARTVKCRLVLSGSHGAVARGFGVDTGSASGGWLGAWSAVQWEIRRKMSEGRGVHSFIAGNVRPFQSGHSLLPSRLNHQSNKNAIAWMHI